MTIEQINYICTNCNHIYEYKDLIKRLTVSINEKEYRYNSKCKVCNGSTFIILTIIIK